MCSINRESVCAARSIEDKGRSVTNDILRPRLGQALRILQNNSSPTNDKKRALTSQLFSSNLGLRECTELGEAERQSMNLALS
jgi:hypothetical protein